MSGRKLNQAVNVGRVLKLYIDADLVDPINRLYGSGDFAGPAATINYLIRAALAAEPADGFINAAYYKAYTEAKRWAFTRISDAMYEIAAQVKSSAKGGG